jgi:hypothetical protein
MTPALPPPAVGAAGDVTAEWLNARLLANGRPAALTDVRVSRSVEATSGIVHFLETRGPSGACPRFLVLKVYRRGWFRNGRNEIFLYRELRGDAGAVPAPALHDSYVDAGAEYCHVLTTDLTPTHRMCDRRRLARQHRPIVRTLARLHAHWWEHEVLSRDVLLAPQGGTVSMIQATAPDGVERTSRRVLDELIPAFCDKFRGRLPRGWRRLLEAAAAAWPALYGGRLAGRRRLTLLHGDTNWANVYLPRTAGGEVRLIDWETCKGGPGAYDLAYLLISARDIEQRRRLEGPAVDCYLDAFAEAGGTGYTRDALLADYRLSTVANLFVALAWCRLPALHDSMSAFLDWDGPSLLEEGEGG